MKFSNKWNYTPYIPFHTERNRPEILSISPSENAVSFEWTASTKEITLFYGVKDQEFNSVKICESPASFPALAQTDYEFFISDGTNNSVKRLARAGIFAGKVINYNHPEDQTYYYSGLFPSSPSIVRTATGRLLISLDFFAHNYPQKLAQIFKSDDDGKTWQYLTDLMPCYWGTLFTVGDTVYMLACSTEYGDLIIGKSTDDGTTWAQPTVLARGSCFDKECGFHKSPCAVLRKDGNLYFPVEYGNWVGSTGVFRHYILKVKENCDLLNATNWSCTETLEPINREDRLASPEHAPIEGCLFVDDNGNIKNLLRYWHDKAILFTYHGCDKPLKFEKTINFPFAHVKFCMVKYKGYYYAFGNTAPARNVLAMARSLDGEKWEIVRKIFDYSDQPENQVGLQYPSVILEGSTLYMATRHALNGAHCHHDANSIVFNKFDMEKLING